MKIAIFLIITFALLIMVGTHLFLYFSAIRFFDIINPLAKKIILTIFLVLAGCFLLSFLLVAAWPSVASNYFYFGATLWLGIMANLLMAAVVGWLFYLIAKYFSLNIRLDIISSLLILIVIAIITFGYFNAQNIRLKFITVKINNLPPDWQGKTAVQISDVHAGTINNKKFLNKLVAKLKLIRKDIVFITGDYFDSRDGSLDELAAPLKELKADKGIYFVTGNHEKYIDEEQALSALKNVGVKILKDEIVNIDGLNIAGVDFPGDMQTSASSTKMLEQIKPDEPTILLYHEPKLIAEAKNSGVDLQLSGHTHNGQIWPFWFFTKLIYGQYYFGLHQEGNYTIYTTSGAGTWGPPIRTGNIPEIVVITLE